ncbi:MAG TPA: phenylalanine--tRNA ligase subunit beta [Gemmatimonadales bacterium]|nr:phenylalanine--tRNA ligase subunit beta [Gemmatimonadales bacterium]
MNVSRRWLEALLDRPLDARETADQLSNLCAPVDGIVPLHHDLGEVLIARVLEVQKHPDADRLSLCQVDAGAGGPVEVVCGAPNVTAGKTYPYAPVGATLPGGLKLERRKIRGVVSNGMLCSAKELGLGQDHAGILELDTAAAPGTRFLDALPIADEQIIIDVGANRPDLLCHRGVARELAAVSGGRVKLPAIPGATGAGVNLPMPRRAGRDGAVDGVTIRLEDAEGCRRYLAAVIRGVKVGKSPAWLANRLTAIGQRSVNNVVDATNYVLFELNQPMHAFDLAKLRGPAVVVRRARPGEKIVTLDGVDRTMTAEMTAICDAERPTIVAGVMGSAESEVTDGTTDLVLECAYFDPVRTRRTRRALGVSSESSYRYERGIDLWGMPDALRRAVEIITAVAGGTVREAPLDLWPEPEQPRAVFLRPARVSHLLGVDVSRTEIEKLLTSVGFVALPKDDRLAVQVPGWRPDVTREVDLIEEVARLRGYDSFPDELRAYRPGTVPDSPVEQAKDRVRQALAGAGFYEARTLSLGPKDSPDAVAVSNPLSAEDAHLRGAILPGLRRRVEHNWAERIRDVRLFEVGTVFSAGIGDGGLGKGGLPGEWVSVAGVLTGARTPPHWTGAKVPDMDIWDLKCHFELAVSASHPGATVRPSDELGGWEAVARDGVVVGRASSLEADAPDWAAPLLGFEVRLAAGVRENVQYRPLPTTPPVDQDVALVLPPGVSAAAVEAAFRRAAGPLLESLSLFDEYRGAELPAGSRSVAWHCVFRDPARTLRAEEAEKSLKAALAAVEAELGVKRRTT